MRREERPVGEAGRRARRGARRGAAARLRIVRAGLLTSVQDLGRSGFQRYGVTVGGAADPVALRVANLLVGNDESAAGLECTLVGPTLRFERETLIAIAGGDLRPVIDGRPVPAWHTVRVRPGATLAFGDAVTGCRAYVAVAGGVDVPQLLGSRSTHLRAGFGGLEGRALRDGDALPLGAPSARTARIAATLPPVAGPFAAAHWMIAGNALAGYRPDPVIRLIPGPELPRTEPESRARLFEAVYRIAPDSDRMGCRLEGPPLVLAAAEEPLTEGVSAGTLQLPPDGRPIALLADHPTTGGYARIGQVAAVDLPVLAQARPGDAVRFQETPLPEAQALLIAREHALEEARTAVRLAASRADREGPRPGAAGGAA